MALSRAAAFLVIFVAVALFSVSAVTAQSSESIAPSPGMDAGAGYTTPVSGAFICSSLLLSLIAFLLQ
ncbi:hypothetical protein BVC80_1779g39 [Macleaya cordata]|uniref:Arabinogalactan peptide n=1 Tax=Macleaya cordata TaxID=56857 RepID=A0A200QPB5_MACCD|nr:hypothetical protein BVC80_1779g39 [Macleaya cordata]